MGSFVEGLEDSIRNCSLLRQIATDAEFSCPRKHGDEFISCAWAPDGSTFAWSLGTRLAFVVRVRTSKDLDPRAAPYDLLKRRSSTEKLEWDKTCLDCTLPVTCLSFGCRSSEIKWHSGEVAYHRLHNFPKGRLVLAVGLSNGEIKIWDLDSCRIVSLLKDHKQAITCARFCPDGSLVLASSSRDGTIKFWDIMDDGNMFQTVSGHAKNINAIAWTPDGKRLASVGAAKSALLWNARSGNLERKFEGHQNDVTGCCFSPDGALLFTSSCDTKVICWDAHSGERKAAYCHMFPAPRPIFAGGVNGHEVRGVDVSVDGSHIVTFCNDGVVRVWNIFRPDVPVEKVVIRDSRVINYSHDGFVFVVGCQSGAVQFFACPMHVSALQNWCRMALRRSTVGSQVTKLNLPKKSLAYLNYCDIPA